MTEYPRFPSSLTTKVLRMRENSRQLEEVRAKRRRRLRLPGAQGGARRGAAAARALAPRLLHDDVPGCARLIAKAALLSLIYERLRSTQITISNLM